MFKPEFGTPAYNRECVENILNMYINFHKFFDELNLDQVASRTIIEFGLGAYIEGTCNKKCKRKLDKCLIKNKNFILIPKQNKRGANLSIVNEMALNLK